MNDSDRELVRQFIESVRVQAQAVFAMHGVLSQLTEGLLGTNSRLDQLIKAHASHVLDTEELAADHSGRINATAAEIARLAACEAVENIRWVSRIRAKGDLIAATVAFIGFAGLVSFVAVAIKLWQ